MMATSEFATIASFYHPLEAHSARNFLEANGVHAFVVDENLAIYAWNNWVEVKLQVPAADAERARQLLGERKRNYNASGSESPTQEG